MILCVTKGSEVIRFHLRGFKGWYRLVSKEKTLQSLNQ